MLKFLAGLNRGDGLIAGVALALMLAIPLTEMILRPLFGQGIANAPVFVQHLGLLLAMAGALVAERGSHLSALGAGFAASEQPLVRRSAAVIAQGGSAVIAGMLAQCSWTFVAAELDVPHAIAYGIPASLFQIAMPIGFMALAARLAWRLAAPLRLLGVLALPAIGWIFAAHFDGATLPLWPAAILLLGMLLCGAPVFAVLGGLALALFWSEGQPLAAVPLSHYQITVNPSLPALPLFTLAGLIFARTKAAVRLGAVFTALFGSGATGSAIAAALLCSGFTALTGGSGVTILALGGLLLPLLVRAGFQEQRGIGLVTSASALGVLLAPSVPLIMYAIIARVPINTMFLAGVLPALVMVFFLLTVGGFLRKNSSAVNLEISPKPAAPRPALWPTLAAAKWELLAPVVAIGSLVSGIATPTESAALTAGYAILTQTLFHREMNGRGLAGTLVNCAEVIGGIMLILGMALGLTNYLIDAGIPDAAIEWVQSVLPNRWAFLIALNIFLLIAGALMEIYAAIVVLVPLLLPVAMAYGIDPVHFGVIFLANIEMGFLCPPAGMNIYFASAMFAKPIRYVAAAVVPAVIAMFCGALMISALPWLATWLPGMLLN